MEPTQSGMEPIHSSSRGTVAMKVLSPQEISAEPVVHEVSGVQRFEISTESRDPRSELPE